MSERKLDSILTNFLVSICKYFKKHCTITVKTIQLFRIFLRCQLVFTLIVRDNVLACYLNSQMALNTYLICSQMLSHHKMVQINYSTNNQASCNRYKNDFFSPPPA